MVPFAFAAALAFATAAFPPKPDPTLLAASAVLCAAIIVVAVVVERARRPGWGLVVPALLYLVVIGLLREAQGGASSGYAPLVMLPVFWVALYGQRKHLAAVIAGVAALFLVPLVGVLDADYPVSEWRRALLWVAVSLVVGLTVQGLVARTRTHARRFEEQRDFLGAVFETAGGLVAVLDAAGRVERLNPACERVGGWASTEIAGRHWWDVLVPDDEVEEIRGGWPQLLRSRRAHASERELVHRDGSRRRIAWTASVLRDEEGEPTHVVATGVDVTEQRVAESSLRESELRYRTLVGSLPDAAIMLFDRELRISLVEGPMLVKQGVTRDQFEGRLLTEVLPEGNFAVLAGALHGALEGESSTVEYGSHLNETVYVAEVAPYEIDGTVTGGLMVARDVTERRRVEAEARAAERSFVESFENAPIGMEIVDLEGRFTNVNKALSEITGYPCDELVGTPTAAITHPDDAERDAQMRASLIAGDADRYNVEKRFVHASGHPVDAAVHLSLVSDADGAPRYFVGQVLDITERKRFESQLQHMADHDPLTGLLNRRRFEGELRRQLSEMARYGTQGAAIVLDVDHFKQVNDSLGHSAGDELIVSVSHILRSQLRETDLLARLGGDEFAILLPRAERDEAEAVASKLVTAVREQAAVLSGERPRQITISVGVMMLDARERLTAADVIVDADLAMYDAKEAGRDRYAFFATDEHHQPRIKARLTWMDRIERAIEQDSFAIHAQPIVDLHSGQVTQHELLLRMIDDHGDLIPPATFLYIAERYGLITRLDSWVTQRAVGMLAELEQRGRAMPLEVNLSGLSIGDPDLIETIERCVSGAQVDPSNLIFEITETAAVADIGRARDFARRLNDLGCRFALDDFGAGFGSFYYLKHLPFDYIKIDGEFVANCRSSRTDQLVIEAVVNVARGLGKETIAEFVPDDQTRRLLRRLGVDLGQGRHFGMPVDPAQAGLPQSVRPPVGR